MVFSIHNPSKDRNEAYHNSLWYLMNPYGPQGGFYEDCYGSGRLGPIFFWRYVDS